MSHGLVGGELGDGGQLRGKVVGPDLGQQTQTLAHCLGLVYLNKSLYITYAWEITKGEKREKGKKKEAPRQCRGLCIGLVKKIQGL